MKRLGYITSLLASPGRELHVLELAGMANGSPSVAAGAEGAHPQLPTTRASDTDPLLDDRAKREYGRRLADLEEELERARDFNDTERAAGLQGELDALSEELARAVGLRGRSRGFSSPAERARISVTKAIRTAIRLIGAQCPELAAHLEASIRTGRFCRYSTPGAVPPRWSL